MLLGDATDSVVHWIDVGTVWSGDMNCGVACSRNQTVTWAVCESAVLLKDKELSQQIRSGARICELVYRLNEDILSKFCDNVDNWLNVC